MMHNICITDKLNSSIISGLSVAYAPKIGFKAKVRSVKCKEKLDNCCAD